MSRAIPRSGILDIKPYVPGGSMIAGAARVIKLASNESALGPSPAAIEAYERAAWGIYLYPDPQTRALRSALSDFWSLRFERLITGAGSENLLDLITRCYAGPGDDVLFAENAYPLYRILAASAGAAPVEAPAPGFTANVDALLGAVTERTKIVMLANPNNPTGTWIPKSEVERLRASLPGHVLLVLDSAYAEYPETPVYSPGIDIVDANPDNTIMTRTFSKMYALANLRVGWAYAGESIVETLNHIRPSFCVSTPAERAAVAALGDAAQCKRERAHAGEWRQKLNERLRGLGYRPVEGTGNFVFFEVPNWQRLDEFLKSKGIIVRPVPDAGAMRVTIGRAEENAAFLDAMREFERLGPEAGAA